MHQPPPTCDQLADLIVGGLAEEAEQGGHTAAVPQRHLVVVGGLAVHQVPQGPAGALLHLRHLVVQLVHQVLDAAQVTHLANHRERVAVSAGPELKAASFSVPVIALVIFIQFI